MPSGKVAAQVSHASMAFVVKKIQDNVVNRDKNGTISEVVLSNDIFDGWVNGSFAKLILSVRSEDEMNQVMERLNKSEMIENVDYFKIIDQGRTVFEGVETWTCTGFVPMKQKDINRLFGSLPLFK